MAHYKELNALNRIAKSRENIESYIIIQDESFNKLQDDIKNNRLEKKMSKRKVISKYGDPIFCGLSEKEIDAGEACLYRKALKYFSRDAIYLYFDRDSKLYAWKVEPAS